MSKDEEYIKLKKSELDELVKERVKEELSVRKDFNGEDREEVSRRDFLKNIGAGAAGLGILGLSPVAGNLKITKNGILNANKVDTIDLSASQVFVEQEDGNSPKTAKGANSITYNVSENYDFYRLIFKAEDTAGSNNGVFLRFNGDSNSNYHYQSNDGTYTTSQNEINDIVRMGSNKSSVMLVDIIREASDRIGVDIHQVAAGVTTNAEYAVNGEFPPSSITLGRGASTNWTVNLYGFKF